MRDDHDQVQHNCFVNDRTARDIDGRVAKVLKDLGDPDPPLRLEIVRELLELDRAYYSSSDGGALEETVHRLKVAGKQVIRRPSLLLDVVKKLDLKALWVPDRSRILIDSEIPSAKQRWGEAHEIGPGADPDLSQRPPGHLLCDPGRRPVDESCGDWALRREAAARPAIAWLASPDRTRRLRPGTGCHQRPVRRPPADRDRPR